MIKRCFPFSRATALIAALCLFLLTTPQFSAMAQDGGEGEITIVSARSQRVSEVLKISTVGKTDAGEELLNFEVCEKEQQQNAYTFIDCTTNRYEYLGERSFAISELQEVADIMARRKVKQIGTTVSVTAAATAAFIYGFPVAGSLLLNGGALKMMGASTLKLLAFAMPRVGMLAVEGGLIFGAIKLIPSIFNKRVGGERRPGLRQNATIFWTSNFYRDIERIREALNSLD